MTVDVWEHVSHALATPRLHDMAWTYLGEALPALKQVAKQRNGTVRGSDAGRCALEVYGDIHGKNAPFEAEVLLSRLDIGSIYGAYIAALFKAGYEDKNGPYCVYLETNGHYLGVPCHPDITVFDIATEQAMFTCEVKTNYKAENPKNPADSWPNYVLQATHQAAAMDVDDYAIFTFAPAAQWNKGQPPIFHRQDNFKLSEHKDDMEAEYRRLLLADADEPPACDVREGWRKRFCKYPECPHRKEAK